MADCVAVDEATLDVVVGDDAGAVAELVPPPGVGLVVVLLVLVAVEDDALGEVGVPADVVGGDVLELDVLGLDVLGDAPVDEDVPEAGAGDVDEFVPLVVGVLLEGVGVGGACSGSHFETVGNELTVAVTVGPGEVELSARGAATEARLCGAIAVLITNAPVVESKIPPAMRPIDTGRTRAKHM